MAGETAVGIDIGTHEVKVVVAEGTPSRDGKLPKIKGTGRYHSSGLRHGYIINSAEATESIKEAVKQAEKSSGKKIRSAFISAGGVSVDSLYGMGSLIISRADGEITEFDIEKSIEAAQESLSKAALLNQKILHVIPLSFKVDGKEVMGQPVGMKGSKLEAKVLFIICLESHLNDLIQAVEDAGVEVGDVMASPIAGSLPTLSKTQKVAGCVLANIGSETVSIVVYENDIPISLKVFPIGSTDITHDIALGLTIDIENAEKLKLGGSIEENFSKKKLEEIVEARLTDIFELVESHLKKIGKDKLLPAGIVISGGGSGIQTIEDVAKALLSIPSRKAVINSAYVPSRGAGDSTWAVAYGLTIWALEPEEVLTKRGINALKKTKEKAVSLIKKFLP